MSSEERKVALHGSYLSGGAVDGSLFERDVESRENLAFWLGRNGEDYLDPYLAVTTADETREFAVRFVEITDGWNGQIEQLTDLTQLVEFDPFQPRDHCFLLNGPHGEVFTFTLVPVVESETP